MKGNGLFLITFLCVLGTGLVAGTFFAFSTFVMKALAPLPTEQAIAAMKSINAVILNSLFMFVFLGTAAACLFLAITGLVRAGVGTLPLLIGSLLYLIGAILVTMIFNVPLNDRLAALVPGSSANPDLWNDYLAHWLVWNHVRGVAALAASACFLIALLNASSSTSTRSFTSPQGGQITK